MTDANSAMLEFLLDPDLGQALNTWGDTRLLQRREELIAKATGQDTGSVGSDPRDSSIDVAREAR